MADEWNHWDDIADTLDEAIVEAVDQAATDGMVNVQNEIISKWVIITRYMLNSVYKRTYTYSTYGQTGQAPKGKYLLPEVDQPEDKYTAYFAVGAWYAWFPNYGTRFQHGRGFWETGIDKTQESLDKRMQQVADKFK